MDKQSRSYYRIICSVIATCTIFMLAFRVALSLVIDIGLPNAGDSAFLYYLSWLGSEGFVPYRDMYDTSFPGTFLVYGLITGLTGYTDVAFRLTDLAVLLLVAALTWRLLGRVSRSGAVISALCFADYFLANPTLALQRDYLGLVLVLTSLVLMVDAPPDRRWRMLFAGVLLALAAAIKPHLLIGAPVIWWYGSNGLRGNRLLLLLMLGGTMLLVWCVFAAVMYLQGALLSFMDMVSNFLPLYMQMDGDINETTWRLPGVWHLLDSVLYVTHIPELVISVTVLLAAMVNGNLRRHWKIALALWLLTMAYRLYVLIGMKGWDYHFIPAQYFFISCFALLFTPYQGSSWLMKVLHTALQLLMVVGLLSIDPDQLHMADNLRNRLEEARQSLPLHRKPLPGKDELMAYLAAQGIAGCIEPRTQGTYGPVFPAMLALQLKPCTRFQLSQMFYHHVRNPYVRSRQDEYIATLEQAAPVLILDDGQFGFYNRFADKPLPFDRLDGTLRSSFDAFESLLERRYVRDFDNHLPYPDRVLVYRRKP